MRSCRFNVVVFIIISFFFFLKDLCLGRGMKMHKQQSADHGTETQAQNSLCISTCLCYISIMLFHFFFCTLRPSEEDWCNVHRPLYWANLHAVHSTHINLGLTENNRAYSYLCLPSSQATSVSCKTAHFHKSNPVPFPHCSKDFFPVYSWWIRIRQVFYPWRLCRFSKASNSDNSGRQSGFDLQWEIIKRVLIHGQSLVHKILSHLSRKDKWEKCSYLFLGLLQHKA